MQVFIDYNDDNNDYNIVIKNQKLTRLRHTFVYKISEPKILVTIC